MSNNHILPLSQASYDESLDEPIGPSTVSPFTAIDKELIKKGMERLAVLNYAYSEKDVINAVEFLAAISYLIEEEENDIEGQSEDFRIMGKMLDIALKLIWLEYV